MPKTPEEKRAYMWAYNQARKNSPKRKAYDRMWRASPAGRASALKAAVRQHRAHPDKRKARDLVNDEVKAGRMIRPAQCPVEGCECPRVEAHHDDYTKPLAVVWLCSRHHKAIHAIYEIQGAFFLFAWRSVIGYAV